MSYKLDNILISNFAKNAAIKRAYEMDKPKLRDPQQLTTYGSLSELQQLNYQSLLNLSVAKQLNAKEQNKEKIILTDQYKTTVYNNMKKL